MYFQVFSSTTADIETHNFPQPVEARFLRIEPTAWNEYCALRFEVLGCPGNCCKEILYFIVVH